MILCGRSAPLSVGVARYALIWIRSQKNFKHTLEDLAERQMIKELGT